MVGPGAALGPVVAPAPLAGAVLPANEQDLAELVGAAAAEGRALFCEGNGSKRHHGPAVQGGTRPLSLRRLQGVTAYEPADLVVSVRAGTRLAELQRVLAEHRQWLPLDPPYPGATVGGVLATASSGPRRLGHGTARDLLLGLRVVGASGTITRSGARVVKNVSGFDLHRPQLGAFGSLGFIVEAHFKVATRPAASGALLLAQPSLAAAVRLLLGIQATALRPVALEALDARAAAALRPLLPEVPAARALAVIAFEGGRPLVDRHLLDLAPLCAGAAAATVLEGSATERLWQGFRDAPARVLDQVTIRLAVRPHDLPALLEGFAGLIDEAATSCHAGHGLARLRFVRPEEGRLLRERLAPLAAAARARGGYLVAEAAPLDLPGRADLPWATADDPAAALARRLKQAFDPHGLLNPGRMALP